MEEYGKILNLSNGQGEFLPFVLRKYRWGDEEDMIACIRDEYGESYFKKELYDRDYIKKKAEEGSMLFLVAKTLCKIRYGNSVSRFLLCGLQSARALS